jgi:hypothetical protein
MSTAELKSTCITFSTVSSHQERAKAKLRRTLFPEDFATLLSTWLPCITDLGTGFVNQVLLTKVNQLLGFFQG